MSFHLKKSKILIVISLLILTVLVSANIYTPADAIEYSADLIPVMTSDTTPSGIASASQSYVDALPWKAFNENGAYYSHSWQTTNPTGWLAYEFSSPKIITKYTLLYSSTEFFQWNLWAKTWTFEGWDSTLNQWVVLDTRTNITDWQNGVKKDFTFNNTTSYLKYRINITANGGSTANTVNLAIGEMEMMETIQSSTTIPNTPSNLVGTPGNSQASLTWGSVYDATSYTVKRSLTAGGPYTTIASNVYAADYIDSGLTNGTTYYYVVTAVNTAGESGNSNEVAVTPITSSTVGDGGSTGGTTIPPSTGNNALLLVTMVNGDVKEYQMSTASISAFISWYDNRSNGTGPARYIISKGFNKGPFANRHDYLVFDKIQNWEVMEY